MSGAGPEAVDEAAAWAEVERRWAEPEAHRAYLDRFPDLDGLAAAGRRYRAVLEVRPTDPRAQEMKGEVLKRATIVGLALMPRTTPPRRFESPWVRRAGLALVMSLASAVTWFLFKLVTGSQP
jgi:hypothetical protein